MTVLLAPAKLTTSLRIVGVRDDGFHLIDAEMITLSLADTLTIQPIPAADQLVGTRLRQHRQTTITVSGAFADGVPTDSRNLVWRALDLAGRRATIHIDKSIPHGGGLGGGSANAAAVLRWAGFTDPIAAGRLGADIPFCLVGGRARVSGIGDIVEPLGARQTTYTIIVPPFGVSTPLVYRAWDDLGGPSGDSGNDLEPAAIAVEPRLGDWKHRITKLTGTVPRMAGSGSTWFLEGAFNFLAEELPEALVLVVTT